jgi:nicotinate-nucleotide pyrophosphorylase (carboxylating)
MSSFAHLLPSTFKEEVIRWAREDCPTTDIGGFVVGEKVETATLYCKSTTVLAGVPFANALLDYYGLTYTWNVEEGSLIDPGSGKVAVARVEGKCRDILLVERTCLNILSRASGVAAAARKACQIKVHTHNTYTHTHIHTHNTHTHTHTHITHITHIHTHT